MTVISRPSKLGTWLRRYSLLIVAGIGGAAGVAYAGLHSAGSSSTNVQNTVSIAMVQNAPPQAKTPTPKAEPKMARDTATDTVQIALLLDTSSSMDGLINQARAQMWNMVSNMGQMTRVVNGKVRGVKVELALYEYGNDAQPASKGFIRQVTPFSSDLDSVSERLNALYTNGGEEYAGEAIKTAANELQWSKDPNALRFIYIAGNESFDQGPITAAEAIKAAAAKDIDVQMILCGTPQSDTGWDSAAKLAKTDLMTIDMNQVAQAIATPQDDEILKVNQQLNGTYMAYGTEGGESLARQQTQDATSARMSKKVAIERSMLKGKANYDNAQWDVIDAQKNDDKFIETAKDGDLPPELRGKTVEEKKQIVMENAAKRAKLQAKLSQLETARNDFLAADAKKSAKPVEQTLENELMKSSRKMASKKGYK
ncbi:MAG TPA: vWA domain-containing protein [Kofleriaceae bacterium]|jgi:hypothetical protein